ncbi:MAG: hypothetical protein ACKN9U_21905, partial [Pirellulaceae bacterium]
HLPRLLQRRHPVQEPPRQIAAEGQHHRLAERLTIVRESGKKGMEVAPSAFGRLSTIDVSK